MASSTPPPTSSVDGAHVDNPYLAGNYGPVADEATVCDLEVRGSVPEALSGHYLRAGPNPLGDVTLPHHWFTGDGMVHSVSLHPGRAPTYRNRWVRTDTVADALGEPRREGPAQPAYDSSNTNVIGFGGRILSLTEGCQPYVLSTELETLARAEFGSALPHGMTAHPKMDPTTGDLHLFAYWWEQPWLLYHRVSSDGSVTQTEAVDLPAPVSMHDFAVTERYVVFFDQPAVFDLDALNTSGFPFRWQPDRGARVGLLERSGGGKITWVEAPLGYSFHPLNAFDADDKVVIDLPVLPSAHDSDLFTSGGDRFLGMQRWTVDPGRGRMSSEVFDDLPQEFCRVSEDRIGRPYRFGYTIELGAALPYDGTRVFKHDLASGDRQEHDFGVGNHPGEFIFVGDPDRAAEEDGGWLIGLVHHDHGRSTMMAVLDAQDLPGRPVCEVLIPRRVPFGFHGNWIAS